MADAGSWLLALAVPLLAVAFLVGVWRWRLFIAAAMQRLAVRLHGRPAAGRAATRARGGVRRPVAGGSSAGVDGDHPPRWVDAAGEGRSRVPVATSDRALTAVFDGDDRVAAILHDPVLSDDAAFNATAASYVLTDAGPAAAGRGDRAARARGARGARPGRVRGRDGAPADRARPARRRPAAPRRAAASGSGWRRSAPPNCDRGLRRPPARARHRGRPGARGGQLAGARDGRPALLTERGLVDALRAAGRSSNLPVTVLGTGVRALRRARSRARRTSAAWRRCRTRPSTRATRPSWWSSSSDEDDLVAGGGTRRRRRVRRSAASPPAPASRACASASAPCSGVVTIDSRPGRGTRVCARIPLR